MTNARLLRNIADPYMMINREERNLAAILYAALMVNDNISKLLDLVGYKLPARPEQTVAYFEYAFLRDLWNTWPPGADYNEDKRRLITQLLATRDVEDLAGATTEDWNRHFGCRSKKHIESPSNWVLRNYDDHIHDNNELLATTKFKWCLNIKPDIVVHTTLNDALVLECKLESSEGRYPSSAADRGVFDKRGLKRVRQTELQQYMFEHMLGIKTQLIYVVKKDSATSETHQQLNWHKIFQALDLEGLPAFVKTWIKRYEP